jgi:hypothetical protein
MDGLNIRSLGEIRDSSMNSLEMAKHLRVLIAEMEEKISAALVRALPVALLEIYEYDYSAITYDPERFVKILIFNLIEVMQKKKYTVKLLKIKDGFAVKVNTLAGREMDEKLDLYLKKFM